MKRSPLTCLVRLVIGLFVVFACGTGFLLVYGNSYVMCFGTLFPAFADVEQKAHFEFPPSAHNIEFDANGVNRKCGCTIWVKFEMDSADLTDFVNTTEVKNLSSSVRLSGDAFEFFSERKGWEQSEYSLAGYTNASFVEGWVTEEQWVFVNTDNPAGWTVFLITNKECI